MNPSEIEVRCPECRVSFPVGTKRCMHCGGRTGPSMLGVSTARDLNELPQLGDLLSGQRAQAPTGAGRPMDLPSEQDQDEGGLRPRGPARLAVGAIWLLLALAGSLYRVCTG